MLIWAGIMYKMKVIYGIYSLRNLSFCEKNEKKKSFTQVHLLLFSDHSDFRYTPYLSRMAYIKGH